MTAQRANPGSPPLILSFYPWEKGRCCTAQLRNSFAKRVTAPPLHPHPLADAVTLSYKLAKVSDPHPLADAGTLRCNLAKASLVGVGWGEGVAAGSGQ